MKTNNPGVLTLGQTAHFLKKHDDYLILTHASPDGDTLGGAFTLAAGLRKIGKKCRILCPDPIPDKYGFFTEKIPQSDGNDGKTVISVDVADLQLLGKLRESYEGNIVLCIDHHVSNTLYAENTYLDAAASASCESVYELLKKMRIPLDVFMAAALFTGIATDTGSFKYANVTSKTHRIAADLYTYPIHADEISRRMFDTKSRNRLELERMVLDGAKFYFSGRCIVLTVTTQMQAETGCTDSDLEGVAVISRSVEGVLAGVSIKQKGPDLYKISLRTYDPLNASEICKKLGGGGHKGAAGCQMTGSLEEITQKILEQIGNALEECHAGNSAAE